jgi:hypothetical protein
MNQTTKPQKNHWDDITTRASATLAFANYLKNNPSEVENCKEDSDYAKRIFANGYFYLEGEPQDDPNNLLRPIPKDTVFRVYDFDPKPERDKLVTLETELGSEAFSCSSPAAPVFRSESLAEGGH